MEPAEVLVLWTVPPDRKVLGEILGRAKAERVYVFAVDPGVDEYEVFMRRFGGLVRYALEHYDGSSTIAELAGAMGHSERVILRGIEVLPALGVIAVRHNGGVRFKRREVAREEKVEEVLRLMLAESRAFRRAYRETGDLQRFLS